MRRNGVFLIALSFLINPYTVAQVASPDKQIGSLFTLTILVFGEVCLFLLGAYLWLRPDAPLGRFSWPLRILTSNRLLFSAYFSALALCLLLAGGALILSAIDGEDWRESGNLLTQPILCTFLALVAGYIAWTSGEALLKREARVFFFSNLLFISITGVSLLVCNFSLSFVVPAWPVRGLHGIDPTIVMKSWGDPTYPQRDFIYNSWGQRDRERRLRPASGIRRVLFVGDSFLEEMSSRPVSVTVEEKLLRPDLEIINLGVSTTGPDEYYYRLKNIGLPLDVKYCFLFFCGSNDFITSRTLPSLFGVAATSPRDSVLAAIGLDALNHLLTNPLRSILRYWGQADQMLKTENELHERICNVAYSDFAAALGSLIQDEHGTTLTQVLLTKDLHPFFDMVKQADKRAFRTWYLIPTLRVLANGKSRMQDVSEVYAYKWVQRARDLCGRNGVQFTLVIIPDGFQVDPKLQGKWKSLTDMEEMTSPRREAAGRLLLQARKDGIQCIDLHEVLEGQAGTYINFDGHWSDHGVDVVSSALVRYIRENLP